MDSKSDSCLECNVNRYFSTGTLQLLSELSASNLSVIDVLWNTEQREIVIIQREIGCSALTWATCRFSHRADITMMERTRDIIR